MKKYEITFIVSENYTEDRAADIAKDVKKLIESKGGKVEKEVFWGKRKLIYKIAKNSFGYYYVFIFDIEPEKANKLNKELNLNEKILRYLIVDFIEGSPFFEGETPETGKEKTRKPVRARVIEEEAESKPEEVEEVKKPVRRATKKEVVEEAVAEPEEKVEEEIKAEEPEKTKVEEPEEIIEEKPEEKVEEEKIEEPEVEEEIKEVKKEKPVEESLDSTRDKEEMAERKPERKQMTEEERKEQLEKKLAELLKDDEL